MSRRAEPFDNEFTYQHMAVSSEEVSDTGRKNLGEPRPRGRWGAPRGRPPHRTVLGLKGWVVTTVDRPAPMTSATELKSEEVESNPAR